MIEGLVVESPPNYRDHLAIRCSTGSTSAAQITLKAVDTFPLELIYKRREKKAEIAVAKYKSQCRVVDHGAKGSPRWPMMIDMALCAALTRPYHRTTIHDLRPLSFFSPRCPFVPIFVYLDLRQAPN